MKPAPQYERKPPPALRLAARIHEQVLQRQTRNTHGLQYLLSSLVEGRFEQLKTLRHRLELCEKHGFQLSRPKVLEELECVLRALPHELTQVELRIPKDRVVLSVAEIARELEQLEEEFGGWRYDHKEAALIVTTEPIVLEEMSLGPFEIRLCLDGLGNRNTTSAYTVVAREPNRPASNDAVTHPHVQDNHLCEGDAAAAIHGALTEGRICDLFVLVRSVLQTYNRDSPYVSLENWNGHPCHDCGYVFDDDGRYYCEGCDHDFCESCISYCTSCDRSLCMGCVEDCAICGERTCSRCIGSCDECDKSCCPTCLKEGPCPKCLEKKQEKENAHDDDESAAAGESPSSDAVPAGGEVLTAPGQAA